MPCGRCGVAGVRLNGELDNHTRSHLIGRTVEAQQQLQLGLVHNLT